MGRQAIKKAATHRVAFFAASGLKCARSRASLTGFSRTVVPSNNGDGGNRMIQRA